VFTKSAPTVRDLQLFNGTTEVANLHISGAANVYASVVYRSDASTLNPAILLTTIHAANSLPVHG
jgi:hypothetical protein